MESMSRPPHRRKHSKNPYDDVLLSNGVEMESLDAHEYAEIFSGSSSIPVLDLSGLDERVGSGDFRGSKLDYSNIFGGIRNDDVAVPYEELFNGSAKKAKPRNPKEGLSPPQETNSLHSSEKLKTPSNEVSDQSADGSKKQFNLSFNKINQPNTDPSNGKTHIAQLHAVPGFTYFVDGASQPQSATENGKNLNSLKCDVSRTWSFSAEVKDGLSHQKSHTMPGKSQSRPPPNLFPKKDAPLKNIGLGSPPYFGEDFDENSVAAASAAALRKAIDQAQESIRLAKMIMGRKKEGYQNKPRQRGSKKEKSKAKYEELEPTLTKLDGVDEKFTPSLFENEAFINAAKIEVESVWEDIEAAKEHGTNISGGIELFPLTGSQSESVYIDKNIELKRTDKNVEAAKMTHREKSDYPVVVTNQGKPGNLKINNDNFGQGERSVNHTEGSEVDFELVGRALNTSQRMQELEKNVEKVEKCRPTLDHAERPDNNAERVLNTPQRTRRQWNVLGEAGKKMGIINQEEREDELDGKGKQELEEMLNGEHVTVLRSELESCNLGENKILGQVETKRETEIVSERKENGCIWKTYVDEANLWFESEEQLKQALEEQVNVSDFPEIEEGEKRVDDLEIDNQKHNYAHDGDELKLFVEPEQNKVEEKRMYVPEYEVSEIIETGEENCAEVRKSAVSYDSDEINYTEENPEGHIDEDVYVNSSSANTIFSESQTNDTCTDVSETQEANHVDLNIKPEEYQKVVQNDKENDNVPEAVETFCTVNDDKEDDNEISGIESSSRVASEEIFVEIKLQNVFDKFYSDENEVENVSVKVVDPEEELPEDVSEINIQNLPEADAPDIRTSELYVEDVFEQSSESDEGSVSTSSHENINGISAHEYEKCAENANDVTPNSEELKDEIKLVSNEEPKEVEILTETEKSQENSLKTENSKENQDKPDKDDYHQRIAAIKKGREREKDRIVVERAIREARERAFAEARERAERAAVEKAAAEARQRAMAEAREKLDKANTEAKYKAERAAVERATAEARQRALEKAMSQKTTHNEGRMAERVSGSSRNSGLKHSFSSSDLENVTESAQRRKARLERHQRIMERAAKALAEKNMRDILAQKEQAERNRLAESLDADIKRWATGKEKNIRALLSTLQYILGPDSGWQPIPLTEIVTTAAVKKAYRKATLCVHPDKVQQRGASIRQKYICEKVFDLLKAAWNRFNSDER